MSGSDLEIKNEPTARTPTTSEIFFSPEERLFRKQYRMGKSENCLRELWRLYNKLADKDRLEEDGADALEAMQASNEALQFMTMLDPTSDRMQTFMQKKYQYLNEGISLVIQAPERPYLLTHKTRELDSPGRRNVLPRAIRATRPEVFTTSASQFESTYAYTKKWMNVTNLNFEVMRTAVNASTQTDGSEILAASTIYNKTSALHQDKPELVSQCVLSLILLHKEFFLSSTLSLSRDWNRPMLTKQKSIITYYSLDHDDAQVDLSDIPLDDDGNPIGKRTGQCEWCGNDILPIPTARVLAKTWERKTLYCCEMYRELVESITKFEHRLWSDKNEDELLFDIRRKVKVEEEVQGKGVVSEEEKKAYNSRRASTFSKWIQHALAKRKASREMMSKYQTRNQAVDTSDLPWDPYETRFNKSRQFNDQIFDDAIDHVYRHAEIVLQQSEIYGGGAHFLDLGDLVQAAAQREPNNGTD